MSTTSNPSLDGGRPVRAIRGPLLRWYRANRRDLPWRRTRNPYAVWVSEVMLQQTRVAAVVPYYNRFLRRFPDVAALARASEDDVLAAWSGLGYYRRARALHEGARMVMQRYGGSLPRDARTLRDLPGIGTYTAGAIGSIAFGLEEPLVDGNVRRVLSRLLAIADGGARGRREVARAAAELVRGADPGDLNQGLMELGATICTPAAPVCRRCPVARACRALVTGDPERFPARGKVRATERIRVLVAVVTRRGKVLLARHGERAPLRGAWDLPAFEIAPPAEARRTLELSLRRRYRLATRAGSRLATATHAIMNRRLRLEAHRCTLLRGSVRGNNNLRWSEPDFEGVPVSGATRKIVSAVLR